MSSKLLDRRQQRTRQHLHQAILHLLGSYSYQSLSVAKITEKAGVARKTFYAHFQTKDELVTEALITLYDELAAEITHLDAETLLVDGRPLSYIVFNHVAQNPAFYRELLGDNVPATIYRKILTKLAAESYRIHAPLRQMAKHITIDPQLVAHYLAGALLGCINWWLAQDYQPNAETMAYAFSQLAAPGILMALGLDANA